MARPRVILADTDSGYVIPLQLRFAEDFFEMIDLEIVTDREFFDDMFSVPQRADILIVSQDLYQASLQKHNIRYIFLMTEQYEAEDTGDLNVNRIYKYSSIKEIFNEIIGKSSNVLRVQNESTQSTQVILVYSACGGTGKTTVAMGISAALKRNYKRVLYINAAQLQCFQHLLENASPILGQDVYAKLANAGENIYGEIKHVIRNELFSYVPPFKAALMSLNLSYSVYEKIIVSAQKSGDFDYIIVDAETAFDENKARLINMADKMIVVTTQSTAAVTATNTLISNLNGGSSDRYIFVCNNFNNLESNALIFPQISLKFAVSDYIEHFPNLEQTGIELLEKEGSIQRVAFLLM